MIDSLPPGDVLETKDILQTFKDEYLNKNTQAQASEDLQMLVVKGQG